MAHIGSCAVRMSVLSLCIAALSPALAFPQSTSVTSAATPNSAQAYVYVSTSKGVYLYNAASNGSLSLVSGSPFSVAGSAVGSNGKYFLSLGTNYLHSYPVASNGALKGQVSQINTQSYGNGCGTTDSGVLDRSGQHIYVQLGPSSANVCSELQSFSISSAGALTFLGATDFNQTVTSGSTPIALPGNGAFGYSFAGEGFCTTDMYVFKRESSGAMMLSQDLPGLATPPPAYDFEPEAAAADASNHLAIGGFEEYDYCDYNPAQLASYTVASDGSMVTTNTTTNMPTLKVFPSVMNMSPSGQFLAVGGYSSFANTGPGLQVFHFNGANPITPYSGVLTTAPIDQIQWDNNNHVYALSNSTKKLYAYTVTSSSITAIPGSPYTIAATPNGLVVMPISCSAPASDGVHICAPASGSSVSSPVLVEAASTVSGTIARMELWVDGVKKYTASSSKQLNTTISLAAGSHRFAVLAINTAGQKWESAVSATVK